MRPALQPKLWRGIKAAADCWNAHPPPPPPCPQAVRAPALLNMAACQLRSQDYHAAITSCNQARTAQATPRALCPTLLLTYSLAHALLRAAHLAACYSEGGELFADSRAAGGLMGVPRSTRRSRGSLWWAGGQWGGW